MIRYLVENCGMDIDKQDNQGNTPQHQAVEKSNMEAMRVLIQKGAAVNIPNENGVTPQVQAITECTYPETLKYLLEQVTDFEMRTSRCMQ